MFISHNIGIVRHISHLIGVLYGGRLLEAGESEAVITAPAHPYTQYLIAAVPRITPAPVEPTVPAGRIVEDQTSGCPFSPRCARRLPHCASIFPGPTVVASGQTVYCHLYG